MLSGGSQTVHVNSPAVRAAALDVKQQLLEMAAEQLKADVASLELKDGVIADRKAPEKKVALKDLAQLQEQQTIVGVGRRGPHPKGKVGLPFVAHFAEVEVDTRTGEVRVLRLLGAHDSGRVMNRLTYQNQVFGGMTMGIGFGMTEGRVLDRNTGKMANANWHDYKIPTAKDVPPDFACLPVDPHDTECNSTGTQGHRRAGHDPHGARDRERRLPRHRHPGDRDADQPDADGAAAGRAQGGEVAMLPSFAYVRPTSLDEAAEARSPTARAASTPAAPTSSAACATASSSRRPS